jgi:hypothetical protein
MINDNSEVFNGDLKGTIFAFASSTGSFVGVRGMVTEQLVFVKLPLIKKW